MALLPVSHAHHTSAGPLTPAARRPRWWDGGHGATDTQRPNAPVLQATGHTPCHRRPVIHRVTGDRSYTVLQATGRAPCHRRPAVGRGGGGHKKMSGSCPNDQHDPGAGGKTGGEFGSEAHRPPEQLLTHFLGCLGGGGSKWPTRPLAGPAKSPPLVPESLCSSL